MNSRQYGEALIQTGKYLSEFRKDQPEVRVMKGIISIRFEIEPDKGYVVYVLTSKDSYLIAKYDANHSTEPGLATREIAIKEFNEKTKLKGIVKEKAVRKEMNRFMKAITTWFNDEEEEEEED